MAIHRTREDPVLGAFRTFIDRCLIADGSVFTDSSLWTGELIEAARRAFRENPDPGTGDFMTRLKGQVAEESPAVQQLMAEMHWALLMFPSTISAATKREQVREIWALSGENLPTESAFLSDKVLRGIGGAGMAFNTYRWKELVYLFALAGELKKLDLQGRQNLFENYDSFVDWITKVPKEGERQFRHMLRYFAFPELVAPITSNKDRRAILEGFGGSPVSKGKDEDRALDAALHQIFTKHKADDPSKPFNFYSSPWREQWKPADVVSDAPEMNTPEKGSEGTNYWKIAPGENAYLWTEWVNRGIATIEWNEIGDLAGISREEFDRRREEGLQTHEDWNRSAMEQVWKFSRIPEGSILVANRGKKEVLGIGRVTGPYRYDPSSTHMHQLPVEWFDRKSRSVSQPGWQRTLIELKLEEFKKITAGDSMELEDAVRGTPRERRQPLNLILYGPPGTGKTFRLQQMFAEYTDAPSAEVDDETWNQSLVADRGWRPIIAAALAQLGSATVPEIANHPLVQATAKQRGRRPRTLGATLWGFLQAHTPEDVSTVKVALRRAPGIFSKAENGQWQLIDGWDREDPESAELVGLMKSGRKARREPIRRYRLVTFHPSFSYEDFVRGIRPVVTDDEGATQFRIVDGVFKRICDTARANPGQRYALFIDEINRANIAKVFGELITLIEPDKRGRYDVDGKLISGMQVQLPGGEGIDADDPPFSVPSNLDIYGTMNTADRSIALLDIALRRRFEFREMEPDPDQLKPVGNIDLGALLQRINDRLEYLLDRDHRIGHAYLMTATTLEDLRSVFSNQIVPLLQEYFFDDMARVAMVLTTKSSAPFVRTEKFTHSELFSGQRPDGVLPERWRYSITRSQTWTEETFRGIYETTDGAEAIIANPTKADA